jgi:hypothetical protein
MLIWPPSVANLPDSDRGKKEPLRGMSMLHARREICEIVRCIPERFLGKCQSWSLTRVCVLGMWRLCNQS